MSSIAARRVNTRACQLQPNGMVSRGTHAYPGANEALGCPWMGGKIIGHVLDALPDSNVLIAADLREHLHAPENG